MIRKVDISHKTIFFIAAFIIFLWVIYLILDVILLCFVAFILMSTLSPIVDKLVGLKIPRSVAVSFVFILTVLGFAGLLTVGFTPLINQTSNLSQKLAETISSLVRANYVDQSLIHQEMTNFSHDIVNFMVNVFKNFITLVSTLVITFYLLLDREKLEGKLATLSVSRKEKISRLLARIEGKLGAWLRGQLIQSIIIGLLVYFGLLALNIDFALPLSIIAAILEVVPVIGPIISAIPGILIALTISPLAAVFTALMYLAVQQLESHVIIPQVMQRAVGLNPILVILAVSVGGRLLGIGGALLAVPIAVVTQVIVEEILSPQEAI